MSRLPAFGTKVAGSTTSSGRRLWTDRSEAENQILSLDKFIPCTLTVSRLPAFGTKVAGSTTSSGRRFWTDRSEAENPRRPVDVGFGPTGAKRRIKSCRSIRLYPALSGQLYSSMGYTITFALLASLLSALTLIPLCFATYRPV